MRRRASGAVWVEPTLVGLAVTLEIRWNRGALVTQQFAGKVVFVTGAARGQGRSHAVRFAEEGADVIALDLCAPIASADYPLASPEDLEETVNAVEKTGQRIVAEQADVRDLYRLQEVVAKGVAEFGRLDFVLANAGIGPGTSASTNTFAAYRDAVDVMLNGVYYTIEAALPALIQHGEGGAIVITSSAGGLLSMAPSYDVRLHGIAGYMAAKHGVIGLMRYFATSLAEKNIRVNSVHPTGVDTPMIMNDSVRAYAAAHPDFAAVFENLLPVPFVECADVTEAMIYLCGHSGRFVTGVTLPVDAGLRLK